MTTLKQLRREGFIVALIAVMLVGSLFIYSRETPTGATGAFVKVSGMYTR